MYYISNANLGSARNAKGKEIQDFVQQYARSLVTDEQAKKTVLQEITNMVTFLNEKYPKTKPFGIQTMNGYGYSNCVICAPEPRTSDSDAVFTLTFSHIKQVIGTLESKEATK